LIEEQFALLLQSFECMGVRRTARRPQSAGPALHEGHVVPPVIDGVPLTIMGTFDDPLVFADDLPLCHGNDATGINAQTGAIELATRPLGEITGDWPHLACLA
jgi:hypothetical protein